MSLNRFCCCCDLRRGCIAFTWLQMMFIALSIAAMAVPLNFLNQPSVSIQGVQETMTDVYSKVVYTRNPYADIIYPCLNMLICEQIIKMSSCVALILGLVKKQHLFCQAWLFVSGVENCILTLTLLSFFFGGFALYLLFIPVIPLAVLVGLAWYFWFCVYAVYDRDRKITTIAFSENYDNISLVPSYSTTPVPNNYIA